MPARGAPEPARGKSEISVLIANDQPILCDGLRAILDCERDIRVVACVRDIGLAVREVDRHRPQVALLGIGMLRSEAIEAVRAIARRSPTVGVLILSMHSTPTAVRRALDASALGYLSRECSGDDLVRGVRAIAAGSRYLAQGLAEKLLDQRRGSDGDEQTVENLTATERQILKLVSEGESNPAVAKLLGLSPRTIETYRLRLMRKLGIANLASLVRYAIRHGITPLD